jgi:uncharacterized membrane protein
MTHLAFENPWMVAIGLPIGAAVLFALARSQWRRNQPWRTVGALAALRGGTLLVLLMLAARPVLVESREPEGNRDKVALLIDRSASMSLEQEGETRFRAAVNFAREVVSAANRAGLRVQLLSFAEDAVAADGRQIAAAEPDGKQTNLARAIVQAVTQAGGAPLGVVALTDGAATEDADNARAVAALLDGRVPFVGVGFGREFGTQSLSLDHATAPPLAPCHQQFRIAAQLHAVGERDLPPFDLILLRDGQFLQKKTIAAGPGARTWQESFLVSEVQERVCRYTVQLLPPADPAVKCPVTAATAAVRIIGEKEFRVLFVQGAMTWDYKFIRAALSADPTIRLSGLSRTANQSTLFQGSDAADGLGGGFPNTLDELAAFRSVVLSNLQPGDLTSTQQELLARFCGELGGGVLMLGGPDTFNAFWRGTALEQLLPVRFAPIPRRPSSTPNFHFQVTDVAFTHPVFQISETDPRAAWATLPTFSQYAIVDSVKPGAQVWATLSGAPNNGAVLMASQRYGAGLSTVICVQNFWRWRLAKESDPQHFDRFWQQLLRYLGDGGRSPVTIVLPDQRLQSGSRVRLVLERRVEPSHSAPAPEKYGLVVHDATGGTVSEQTIDLSPGGSADVTFTAERAGLYTASVLDPAGTVLTSRSVDVRDVDVEFVAAARNMESLRQWASVSGGIAVRSEEGGGADRLIAALTTPVDRAQRTDPRRSPVGINGWMLCLLLCCLGGEWSLRKHWGLT